MSTSCAIADSCDLGKEALKYMSRDEACALVLLSRTDAFKNLRIAKLNGDPNAQVYLQTNKDNTPTLKTMIRLLRSDSQNQNIQELKQLAQDKNIEVFKLDFDSIVRNKILEIARTINRNAIVRRLGKPKNNEDEPLSVTNLSREEAQRTATAFNQINADDTILATIVKEKRGKYAVCLKDNTPENKEQAKKDIPLWAAIETLSDFLNSIGIEINFDTINDTISGVIEDNPDYRELNEDDKDNNKKDAVINTCKTLITICCDRDSSIINFDDIPNNISHDVGKVVARLVLNAYQNNPAQFNESPFFERLRNAVEHYMNVNGGIEGTVEEIMEDLLADEIQKRIQEGFKNTQATNSSGKAMKRALRSSGSRGPGRIARAIVNILPSLYEKSKDRVKHLLREKYFNKPISFKDLQKQVTRAVDDMFSAYQTEKDRSQSWNGEVHLQLQQIGTNALKEDQYRDSVKRYKNNRIKSVKNDLKQSVKYLVDIEKSIKRFINKVEGPGHRKALTRFEKVIELVNDGITSSNSDGNVSQRMDSVTSTIIQSLSLLRNRMQEINTDLAVCTAKLNAIIPDMTNQNYINLVNEYAQLQEEFEAVHEILEVVKDGMREGLISISIKKLTPDGNVEETTMEEVVSKFSALVDVTQNTLNTQNNILATDLLVAIYGTPHMDIVMGKMMRGWKGKKTYTQAKELWEEELRNFDKKNTLYHKALGSIQNSKSLINQVVGLAINQQNANANNATQSTLYYINNLRQVYLDKQGFVDKVRGKNDPLVGLMQKDDDGVFCGNLVRPIDYYQYEKELEDAEKAWSKEFNQVYSNRDLTDTQKSILWKQFRQQKFSEWNRWIREDGTPDLKFKRQEITMIDPTGNEVTKKLMAPNILKYPSSQWDALSDNQKHLSNAFFGLKYYSNEKLDEQGSQPHKIPMFRGSFWDRYSRGKSNASTLALNSLKRAVLVDILDDEFGAERSAVPYGLKSTDYSRAEMEANDIRRIPLYGIRKLPDMRELSTDLFSSYLAYDQMANNYKAKSNIEFAIHTIQKQVKAKTDDLDKGGIKEKIKWYNRNDFRKELDDYVEKELYGIKKNDITLGTFGISLAKIMNQVGRFTTNVFLGGNVHSAFVNLLTGYNEIVKEAGVGRYFNVRDVKDAEGFYIKHTQGKFFGKNGEFILKHPNESNSATNILLREFNFTENFQHDIREYNSRQWRIHRLRKNLLMLPYSVTDHWMQAIPLVSMLKHEKVYTRALEKVDSNGDPIIVVREISLLEALHPEFYRNKNAEFVERPETIKQNSNVNFGIFFKTAESAEKGEPVVKLLDQISGFLANHKTDPKNTIFPQLNEVWQHDVFREMSKPENGYYRLTTVNDDGTIEPKIPQTVEDFKIAQASLQRYLNDLSYNASDYANTRLRAREIVNRMHGVYDTQSKGSFNRTILGANVLSMKNYAVGLINRRLMSANYNITLGGFDEGTFITTLKVIWDALRNFGTGHPVRTAHYLWALINPIRGLQVNSRLKADGYVKEQIDNLQRAKLDIFRISFMSMLSTIIKGLGKTWLGGDDDDEYEYISITMPVFDKDGNPVLDEDGQQKVKEVKIKRSDVLSGKAYEEGGSLYSDITLSNVLQDAGILSFDEKNEPVITAALKYKEEKEIIDILLQDIKNGTMFTGYGASQDKDGIQLDEDNIDVSSRGGYTAYINGLYEELYKRHPELKGARDQFKKVLLAAARDTSQDVYKLKKDGTPGKTIEKKGPQLTTIIDTFKDALKEEKKIKDKLEFDLEEETNPEEKKRLKEELKYYTGRIRELNEVVDGAHYREALHNQKALPRRKEAMRQKYGVKTDQELLKLFAFDKPTDAEIYELYCKDEKKIENTIKRIEKRRMKDEFGQNKFREEHPNAYYWLGVTNYFLERVLIEQQSFIPGGNFISSQTANVIDEIAQSIGCRPLPPQETHWDGVNEMTNLVGLPAFVAATQAVTDIPWQAYGYMKYDSGLIGKDFEQRQKEIRQGMENAETAEESREWEQRLEELNNDYYQTHAKNTGRRLKEGDPKLYKNKSLIPYVRTGYIFGFDQFLNDESLEGGWNATTSFKSFFQKDKR